MDAPLQISYESVSDTLDIGTGGPASDGQQVCNGVTVFFNKNEDVVNITIDHAAEVLAPYLRERIADL